MAHRGSWSVSCLLLLGSLAGCSHKPPPPPAPVARAAPPPRPQPRTPTANVDVGAPRKLTQVAAIHFDFDSALVRDDARPTLQAIAETAKTMDAAVRVEGHTDERGTTEYNLALGDRRARAAGEYLERLGIPKTKITVVTFGSERPKVTGNDESAWSQNRRGELVVE